MATNVGYGGLPAEYIGYHVDCGLGVMRELQTGRQVCDCGEHPQSNQIVRTVAECWLCPECGEVSQEGPDGKPLVCPECLEGHLEAAVRERLKEKGVAIVADAELAAMTADELRDAVRIMTCVMKGLLLGSACNSPVEAHTQAESHLRYSVTAATKSRLGVAV